MVMTPLEKHAAFLSRKYLGPICEWLSSFFNFLDPKVGGFYRGEFGGLKYFVTFVLIWVFGILLWVYSFKQFKKRWEISDGLPEGFFPAFLFIFSCAIRAACGFGLVQFGLELTIASYGEKIVNNTCYMDNVNGMTLLDSSTWPYWALILTVLILIRFALNIVFNTIRLKPLSTLGFVVHIFCFLSIGWLLAHLVYILDLVYQNMTLATVLFGLIAQGISSIIRCAIPILTDILVLIVLIGFLLLIASPILVPIINLIAMLCGGGGGSPSPSSSSGSTEKMITTSTYDNGWEISSETHPATLLDVLCMPGNTLSNIIWFLG